MTFDIPKPPYPESRWVVQETGYVTIPKERVERLRTAVERALHRYDDPRETHNVTGSFPRGELAWAMASDLRDDLQPGDLDPHSP